MPYAPATHWEQVIRTRRDTGEDLEDQPLRAKRKPPGWEIAPNYITRVGSAGNIVGCLHPA